MRFRSFDAVILDMDGVVTRTAVLHARAWKRMFDEFLERRGEGAKPFDIDSDYLEYVDGKPRYEGARSFLEARRIRLPQGDPQDDPGLDTICGLGNRKDRLFHELLNRQGVEVFDDAVEQIDRWRRAGLKTAIVSSSKNCGPVLKRAGLLDRFDVRVDGLDVQRHGLDGKAGIFRRAAEELEVSPAKTIVVEDSVAGVEAGAAAGFGVVVGVARGGDPDRLRRRGAHVVVAELRQLSDAGLEQARNPPGPPPDALRHLDEIETRLGDRDLAFFLDYDGTLTPIVDRPEQAVLSSEMRSMLDELSAICTVAVVSGRDRRDVAGLVGLDRLIYAGSHGFDISGPDGLRMQYEPAREHLPELDRAEHSLRDRLEEIEGLAVERKAFAIAVHYRRARNEQDVERAKRIVSEEVAKRSSLVRTAGKKIVELRPDVDWNKGRAVEYLMEALHIDPAATVPVYIGDDTTDEDAFAFLRQRGIGLGILVGPPARPSGAAYYLDDPEAARGFLSRMLERLRER